MDMASFEKEVIPNDPTPVRVLTSDDWVSRLKERGREEYLPKLAESEVIKLCS